MYLLARRPPSLESSFEYSMTPWWQWTKTSWRFSFFLAIIGFVSLLKEVLCLFLLISKRSWDKFRVNFTCFSRFYLYYVGIIQRDAEPSPKSPYVLSNIRPTTTTTTSIQHYLRHVRWKICNHLSLFVQSPPKIYVFPQARGSWNSSGGSSSFAQCTMMLMLCTN